MTRAIFLACLALATTMGCDLQTELPPDDAAEIGTLPADVDVSENMYRFVFDEAPVFDDGMPAYGNAFITEGYLYPAGYLDDKSGVNPDGSAADPDAVIGVWICRGVFVGDGAHTASGPAVITTQYFDFYDGSALVTEGYETLEVGVELARAITGGTGDYRRADGEAMQTFLGFNDSEGVELRVHFEGAHSRS